jgi:hypothetical protein
MTRPPDEARWALKNHLLHLYEVDTEALLAVLPRELDPVEVRPGVGLLGVECLGYLPSPFGDGGGPFDELVIAVAVQPNLGIAMPVPRYCIHALSIRSNSRRFVDEECAPLWSNVAYRPGLRLAFSADGASCEASDEQGPIARCLDPDPSFVPKVLWGQYYTTVGEPAAGIWRWEGWAHDRMTRGAPALAPHEVFAGLDVRRVRAAYRQMAARPGPPLEIVRWLPGVTPTGA